MGEQSPVIELVQNPLAIPFDVYFKKFKAELEPILLAQPGIISIFTGTLQGSHILCLCALDVNLFALYHGFLSSNQACIGAIISPDSNESFAVSVTQWDSMKSHEQFLNSSSAGPFFDKAKPTTRGPPTIEHYTFGIPPQAVSGRPFAYLQKLDAKENTEVASGEHSQHFTGDVYRLGGECIEHPGKKLVITFGNLEDMQLASKSSESGSGDSSFLVRFSSIESSKSVAML